jgi:hypothetical protein
MLTPGLNSGTTCYTTTNRASPATATTDSSYAPAICEHGYDPTYSTPRSRWRIQPTATADAESIPTELLSVPQSNATAADECSDGCSYTTFITSS